MTMADITGNLRKLATQMDTPIHYSLSLCQTKIPLNPLIGKQISLQFLNEIQCVQCDRKTTKSFHQGHCYPCYKQLLECNLCVIHPEKCNYPSCPDTWAHEHCGQDHIVYLANSSGLKVGITRSTQVPTRWIDQGAIQAIPLFKVTNRLQSGMFEVHLKQHVKDKTNWRQMLQEKIELLDMNFHKDDLLTKADIQLNDLLKQYQDVERLDLQPISLQYPIMSYPQKMTALGFEKTSDVKGKLLGIKGQYLLLENGVLNIRKYSGYKVKFSYEDTPKNHSFRV